MSRNRSLRLRHPVAEIVTGYGYPESAIIRIVIAKCALVLLYVIPFTPQAKQSTARDQCAERRD